jgi:hypothetical protein
VKSATAAAMSTATAALRERCRCSAEQCDGTGCRSPHS